MSNKHKVVFKPGFYQVATNKLIPGLYLEDAITDFLLSKNLATNPSGDCCTLVSVGGSGGAVSNLALGSRTATTNVITNSNGTGFTLLVASATQAGLESPAHFTKSEFITVTAPVDLNAIAAAIPLKQDATQYQIQTVNLGLPTVTTVNFTGSGVTGTRIGNVVTYDFSASSGTGVTDGDKGDIIVSAGGTVWTLDTNSVTNLQLADMPANTVKVRNASTAGDPADMVLTSNQLLGRGQIGDIAPITLGANLSMVGNVLTGASGATNLTEGTRTATTVEVLSDTGTDATLSPATPLLAGVMPAADKVKSDFITVTQAVDLDALEQDVADLTTLSGVSSNSVDLGTFTGATIPDNSTTKVALQALESALEAGDTVTNGLTGNGSAATPHKLGGSLTENTAIAGADFNFNLLNAGVIQLETDTTVSTHRSEILLTGSNTLGTILKHTNKATPTRFAQVLLDDDTTMGLTYQVTGGQDIGFKIAPNTTTATSKTVVTTPNVALGTAITGQVLALQADGSTEYQTLVSGGINRYLQNTANQLIDVKYFILSGTPSLSFTSVSGVGTLTVTGGIIELDRVQVDTGAGKNAWDGVNKYKLILPTPSSGSFLQYPMVNVINTNGNTTPTPAAAHLVRNPGSTPVVTYVGGTAGTNIEILTGDLTIVGTGASIVLKF